MTDFDTRLENNRDRLTRLEERDANNMRVVTEYVVKPLQDISKRMEEVAQQQAELTGQQKSTTRMLSTLTEMVRELERRVDSHDARRHQ